MIEKCRKLFSNLNDLSLMTISGQRVPLNVNTCKMTLYWLVINLRKSFCTGKQYNIEQFSLHYNHSFLEIHLTYSTFVIPFQRKINLEKSFSFENLFSF